MTYDLDRVAEIYAADMLMSDAPVMRKPFGLVEIAAFLTRPEKQLTPEQTRLLFADPKLRGAYQALKKALEYAPVPILLAASSGQVSERTFPQGHMRIIPARSSQQVYLRLSFLDPDPDLSAVLIIESPDGGLEKRVLPRQDERGEVLVVLDPENLSDANLLAALRDPNATGSILAMGRVEGLDETI